MKNFEIINESIKHEYEGNRNEIYNLGEIDIIDKSGKIIKVKPKDIIDVIDKAMFYFQKNYPYLHVFINLYKIMYVPVYPSKICDTMAVDENNNLWINLNFVYTDCSMNMKNVFGLLFHEMFHVFFSHIVRFNKMFPQQELTSLSKGMKKALNKKANIAMDYEVNASMVEDKIVDENFWKNMNGLYKKEYTGKTWEEIYKVYGDMEYKEWLERNGEKISDEELEIINAIEKAAKVLNDPKSTDREKANANRELEKTLDKILGRNKKNDIRDIFEEMKNTQLSDFGNIEQKMQEVIDDLYKDPSKMADDEFEKLMNDVDEMSREFARNKKNITDRFNKSDENETFDDIKKMRKTLKETLQEMRNKKMSNAEKKEALNKIKDSIEDVISNDLDKEKNKEKRKIRDEEIEKEKFEEFKKSHPLRKLMNVFKNLMDLSGDPYNLVREESYDIMKDINKMLDTLTEIKLSDYTENDIKDLKSIFPQLKDSLFEDLKKLIYNKTIINKTEDDLYKELDKVFKHVESVLFSDLINPKLNDYTKMSGLLMAAEKMRKIGQILKTQKSWIASDEFYEGYREMRDELISLYNKDIKALLKRLYDMGVLNDMTLGTLDEQSQILFDELVSNGEIKLK
jgi:hypothetical protein